MSTDGMAPKPNRTPWIIAGVLGCLVVCLLIAVVGGGAYVFLGQSQPTQVVRVVPTVGPLTAPTLPPVVVPTQPVAPSAVVQPTVAQIVPPTLAPAVGQPGVISPTLALAVGQPTVAPTNTPKPAAPTGRLAFTVRRGDRPEDNYIWTMNADGSNAKELLKRSSEPSFSPDGTKIAFYQWRDGIFVANADGTNPKRVVGDGNSGFLSWSHDGRTIAFSVRPGGQGNIVTDAIAPDGSGRHPIGVGWSPYWTPDDTQIIFVTCRGSGCGLFKIGAGGGDAIPIITDDSGLPAMSPDGKKIVYQKDTDGQKQLFLINADGSGKQQLTSGASLHVSANWSPDGNFIFYRSPEGGQWGIWRMNADGSNPVKLANDMPPGDWPYDRIAVTK